MFYPINAHIEPTFGCNNKCDFCYQIVLEKKQYDYMTIETAESISKAFDNKLRVIKFALRGEPLLNPELNQIVNILHKNNPDTVLLSYTNGKLLTHKKIEELFTNGLNYIYVNAYNNTFKEYRKKYENYDIRMSLRFGWILTILIYFLQTHLKQLYPHFSDLILPLLLK